jgi:hypothetical protein
MGVKRAMKLKIKNIFRALRGTKLMPGFAIKATVKTFYERRKNVKQTVWRFRHSPVVGIW